MTQQVKIIEGERPPRPVDPTLTDNVWTLVERCWDQEPQSRPGMKRVLQDLAPSLLQSLHRSSKSSPEFQVALSQFYDSTERETCLSRLDATELKKFVVFLDDVRQHFDLSRLDHSHNFRLGTTDQGIKRRATATNPTQPTGGVRRLDCTSEVPRNSPWIFQINRCPARGEWIR